MRNLIDIVTEGVRLPGRIVSAIAEFKDQHPEYATRDGATDKCRQASSQFCDLLIQHGYRERDVYVDEIAVVDGVSHRVATCAGYWIDWTARQYDENAPWPAVGRDNTPWTYA